MKILKIIDIGVNKYRLEKETPIEVRSIDNTAVREAQIARLNNIMNTRDKQKVEVRKIF